MSYIEYLNDFNQWLEEDSPTDKAVILYYAMLNMFNRKGWPRWARVDTQRLMMLARTTDKKVAFRARDTLVKAGFLQYKSGKRGTVSEYQLLKFGGTSTTENATKSATENATKSATENATPNKTKTKTKTEIKTTTKTTALARDEALGRVMSSYMDKIGFLSSTGVDELKGYVKSLGAEVCLRAIDYAIDAGEGKNNWLYIRGILWDKQANKVHSNAEWDRLEERRKSRSPAPRPENDVDLSGIFGGK